MLRLTAIFIAICVVVIGASLGAVGYLLFGLTAAEAVLAALTAIVALALYNAVNARLRDRREIGGQIADLSRGTADLSRQVAELGRRMSAAEQQDAARRQRAPNDPLVTELGELGMLVRQLAEAVTSQEERLSGLGAAPAAPAVEPEPVKVVAEPAKAPPAGPLKSKSPGEITAILQQAIEDNRIDLYLQPVVTLPQRKVRYYEAMTRLRLPDGTLLLPGDFLPHVEDPALLSRIDEVQLFRCVQVLRRLLLKNREIGLFCNLSMRMLDDPASYRRFLDFLGANRALAPSLILEFPQDSLRGLGRPQQESLAALFALGFRFSMDHVADLRLNCRELSDLGVRFVKAPVALLLGDAEAGMPAAELSDLLGRHGISLIAERIEVEASVVDLLDCDVRFGQGFLFSPPRPVRAEALSGAAGPAVRAAI